MRPPKPRYTHTWDLHLVTKCLACPEKTEVLHLKLPSIKLAMPLPFPARNELHPLQGLSFLHSRVCVKARLSRSTTSSLFCVLSTQRETLSRWHFTPLYERKFDPESQFVCRCAFLVSLEHIFISGSPVYKLTSRRIISKVSKILQRIGRAAL